MKLTIEKGNYLVVAEWESEANKGEEIEKIWKCPGVKVLFPDYAFYKGINKNTYVLLYEVENFGEIQDVLESQEYKKLLDDMAPYMASDIHQGIYGLVDAVKERPAFVPTTNFVQLRSIEVPLSGIDTYLEWRKNRIYKYVKKNDKVESFLSFHSVLATEPGVLFVSAFEGDPDEYRNSFLTDEYKQIIKEAGHDHIKGGLNTFEYVLVDRK
ncbi:MAG: hypothetical protein WCD89_21455 [Anaerocolumna sp.]